MKNSNDISWDRTSDLLNKQQQHMQFGWETSLIYENWFFYYYVKERLLEQLLDDVEGTRST